jgi:GntR family transcriptional regulator/MocR family aminotransferase
MLSELIAEGEIYRLLKKNIVTYKKRRDVLCETLKQQFEDVIQFEKPSGGLAIWLKFIKQISLVQLANEVEALDVFLPKTILYQDKDTCAIRFGFGHLNEDEIEDVVIRLKQAYDKVINF